MRAVLTNHEFTQVDTNQGKLRLNFPAQIQLCQVSFVLSEIRMKT